MFAVFYVYVYSAKYKKKYPTKIRKVPRQLGSSL